MARPTLLPKDTDHLPTLRNEWSLGNRQQLGPACVLPVASTCWTILETVPYNILVKKNVPQDFWTMIQAQQTWTKNENNKWGHTSNAQVHQQFRLTHLQNTHSNLHQRCPVSNPFSRSFQPAPPTKKTDPFGELSSAEHLFGPESSVSEMVSLVRRGSTFCKKPIQPLKLVEKDTP